MMICMHDNKCSRIRTRYYTDKNLTVAVLVDSGGKCTYIYTHTLSLSFSVARRLSLVYATWYVNSSSGSPPRLNFGLLKAIICSSDSKHNNVESFTKLISQHFTLFVNKSTETENQITEMLYVLEKKIYFTLHSLLI